jgi:hypothetical protein
MIKICNVVKRFNFNKIILVVQQRKKKNRTLIQTKHTKLKRTQIFSKLLKENISREFKISGFSLWDSGDKLNNGQPIAIFICLEQTGFRILWYMKTLLIAWRKT